MFVTRLEKYDNIDTSLSLNDKKDDESLKTNKDGNLSEIIINNRSRFWKSIIDQLGQIPNINLDLKKQQENCAKLQKSVN